MECRSGALLKERGALRSLDTLLRVTVPPVPGYNIPAPETSRWLCLRMLWLSRVAPIMDLPAFVIHPQQGFAVLEAPLMSTEARVQSGSGAAPTRSHALATEASLTFQRLQTPHVDQHYAEL